MKVIKIILSEEEYAELLMNLNRNYLINVKELINKIKERGDINVQ